MNETLMNWIGANIVVVAGIIWRAIVVAFDQKAKITSLEHAQVRLEEKIANNKKDLQNQMTEYKTHFAQNSEVMTQSLKLLTEQINVMNGTVGELKGMITVITNERKGN